MKIGQLAVVLILLMSLIFVLAFVSEYMGSAPEDDKSIGNAGEKKPKNYSGGKLVFTFTSYPEFSLDSKLRASNQGEFYKEGHQDFWFINPTDKPVQVGLDEQNCTCSTVGIAIAPESWKEKLEAVGEEPLRAKEKGFMPMLVSATIGKQVRSELAESVVGTKQYVPLMKNSGKGVEVPANAFGFVRMTWDGKKGGNEGDSVGRRLVATLWFHERASGDTRRLEVKVHLSEPVRIETNEIVLPVIREKGQRQAIYRVWSATRDDFKVKIEAEGGPLVQAEQPLPLTAGERQMLSEKFDIKVKSGYRLAVTINERLDDGKLRFPQGPFTRKITITPSVTDSEKAEQKELPPIHATVRGKVSGPFSVKYRGLIGLIDLGSFSAKNGISAEAIVTSENAEHNIVVHEVPEQFQVKLEELKDNVAGSKSWKLYIVAPRNSRSGAYSEAITLRVTDETNRLIRIPLKWVASR